MANAVTAALCDQDSLDNTFCATALTDCVAVLNMIPNTLSVDVSPMFAVTGIHPDFTKSFLFRFGQPVVSTCLDQERSRFKFAPKRKLGYAVGMANSSTLIYFPGRKGTK